MADRPSAIQAGATPGRAAEGRFLVFHVAGRLYALPGEEVSEIIRIPPIARLPHSPKSLMGLTNLRGAILPMVDTRSLLGRGTFAASAAARAIVTTGATPVALAVDTVDALVVPPADQIEIRQAELAADPGERLRGAFRAPGRRGAGPSDTREALRFRNRATACHATKRARPRTRGGARRGPDRAASGRAPDGRRHAPAGAATGRAARCRLAAGRQDPRSPRPARGGVRRTDQAASRAASRIGSGRG